MDKLVSFYFLLYFSIYVLHYTVISGDVADDGGWSTNEYLRLVEEGPCDIEVLDSSLTQEQFIDRFAYRAPVIIRGNTHNAKFQDLCRRNSMLENFGDKVIRLSSANTHSYEKKDMTLLNYVENMKPQSLTSLANETFYWFGDNNHTEWDTLFREYIPPKYTLPGKTGAYSFGVAAAGTGVPFHFHGPGFAEVVFGRKRWFVYPPHMTPKFHPNQTTLHWYHEVLPTLPRPEAPNECTVHMGDYIYFPDHWWHATLNIDTSVFISTFLG